MGTPKTIREAIENGIAKYNEAQQHERSVSLVDCIAAQIKDFQAQKIGAAMLKASEDRTTEMAIAELAGWLCCPVREQKESARRVL